MIDQLVVGSFIGKWYLWVRWCYNVVYHSVGRVPFSYPRGVRRPTALYFVFYPMPFLAVTVTVTFVCLSTVCFGIFVSRPLPLSCMPFYLFCSCRCALSGLVFVSRHRTCSCIVLRCFVSFSFSISALLSVACLRSRLFSLLSFSPFSLFFSPFPLLQNATQSSFYNFPQPGRRGK